MIIFFNIVFVVFIVFIAYWFWVYKPKRAEVVNKGDVIDIIVDNGVYVPASVQTKIGQTVRLRFTRKTASPCASTVVFADFEQSAELPLDQAIELSVTPSQEGSFDFTCEMGMYRGKIIVV